jgi:hypothetical protein
VGHSGFRVLVKGERMIRKYEELSNRIRLLQIDNQFKDQQILNIKKILIDAGILVEVEASSSTPTIYPIENKLYTVKKEL